MKWDVRRCCRQSELHLGTCCIAQEYLACYTPPRQITMASQDQDSGESHYRSISKTQTQSEGHAVSTAKSNRGTVLQPSAAFCILNPNTKTLLVPKTLSAPFPSCHLNQIVLCLIATFPISYHGINKDWPLQPCRLFFGSLELWESQVIGHWLAMVSHEQS